ncbi:Hint domain-containing protein [Cognatishimia sp. MH4019]|uniref:Hint domain-containing protein n=1 Tax=Cognatishimia sp. MH4019 TaxID=2854030 RepID=UPI001CD34E40|nr:Hint domain-containing protein [Cognatishimia sp. MH4019]
MAKIIGTDGNDALSGTSNNDEIQGLGGSDTISGGNGRDVIYGDSAAGANPDALVYTPTTGRFTYATGSNLGNGNPGGSNHRANVADSQVSNLQLILPTGDLTLQEGETVGFSFVDENGNTIYVEEAEIQQTAFAAPGANETGVLTAQGVDQNGREVALLLAFNNNDGTPPNPLPAGAAFFDNDSDPDRFNGTDIELPASAVQPIASLDGDDVINAGGGDDQVFGGGGDDTIDGDQGQDRIFGGTGNDVIDGGQGNDRLYGNEGDDTISGGQGQDRLFGGDGDDTLDGGDGNDRVFGEDGDDTLVGGPGNDRLRGGEGDDRFTFAQAGNHDIRGGEDADGNDVDVIDLTGVRANVIQTGAESGRIEFLDNNGNVTNRANYREIEQIIICFTPGTRIATPNGARQVETLCPGDSVFTRDNGVQELRWVGAKSLTGQELAQDPKLRPVLIRAGSLGMGLPERDMMVSPNHRMLLSGTETALMFGEREVLASAKHLTRRAGIDTVEASGVTYLHLLFDRHEVILADGAWTESFQPGDYSVGGLDKAQRCEVLRLFPELETQGQYSSFPAARQVLRKHEAKLLA